MYSSKVYSSKVYSSKVYLSKVHFCKMYATCVSSKLCEFIYFECFSWISLPGGCWWRWLSFEFRSWKTTVAPIWRVAAWHAIAIFVERQRGRNILSKVQNMPSCLCVSQLACCWWWQWWWWCWWCWWWCWWWCHYNLNLSFPWFVAHPFTFRNTCTS